MQVEMTASARASIWFYNTPRHVNSLLLCSPSKTTKCKEEGKKSPKHGFMKTHLCNPFCFIGRKIQATLMQSTVYWFTQGWPHWWQVAPTPSYFIAAPSATVKSAGHLCSFEGIRTVSRLAVHSAGYAKFLWEVNTAQLWLASSYYNTSYPQVPVSFKLLPGVIYRWTNDPHQTLRSQSAVNQN